MTTIIIKPTLLLFFIVASVTAQNQNSPWSFSVNSNIINLQGDNVESGINFGGPSLSLSRHIGAGISLGAQTSLGNVNNFSDSYTYTSLDGFLKFNLSSGSFIPSIIGGYGFSQFADGQERPGIFPSSETSRTIFGGLGFSFNLSDNLAINLQSTYRSMNENDGFDHLQHNVGLSLGFGSGDADKDGVPDSKDKCPSVPGLKEYEGCPDTDGDTIIDKEDKCPEIPGLPELNGCIDSDEDGISDPDDSCPDVFGSLEMNGCPDTDQDGVADKDDECPSNFGPIENNGCPWPDTDGDGVNDNEDLCKDEPGSKENNGCPELSGEIVKTLNEFGSRINFPANSYQILGRKTIENLEKIKNLLDENQEGNLLIEGYASSDGDEDYNVELSIKRAQAVLEYLVKLGVPETRLEVIGFGEENPLEDNQTSLGRAINRRVQFKSKR